jgi:FtsP/CotA-like multicopper oxidase with cupredoxin domain
MHPEGTTPPDPSSRFARRDLLRMGLAGGGALAATPLLGRLTGAPDGVTLQGATGGVISGKAPTDPPKFPHFSQELKIPTVLTGKVQSDGRTHYTLTQSAKDLQVLPKPFPPTRLLTFNGSVPGPTIRQARNAPSISVVRNINALPAGNPYSTHLHGSPSQPFYDGHPDDLTQVGAEKTYVYPNQESARTLWYHDHAIHQTADHVYRGLAGFFIHDPSVEEASTAELRDLPTGKYDVPLMVGDMQFTPQGRLFFDDHGEDSLWGNVVLVNGVPWPYMNVDRAQYRFRILAATASRGYEFRLSNGMPFTLIGTDAGLVRTPVQVASFRHGMAERYEVVVDFSGLKAGTEVTLLNTAADDQMGEVMRFRVGSHFVAPKRIPSPLGVVDLPNAGAVVNTRRFRFERSGGLWVINGLPWDERVVATPRVNTTERWVFENKSGGWFHPIHVHLVDFLITKRNGGAAFPYENGLKDVAFVGPNETVEVLMRFNPAPRVDPGQPVLGKYVMHCHNTVHEDHDMMTEFDVKGAAAAQAARAVAPRRKMQPSMMVQWELRA